MLLTFLRFISQQGLEDVTQRSTMQNIAAREKKDSVGNKFIRNDQKHKRATEQREILTTTSADTLTKIGV